MKHRQTHTPSQVRAEGSDAARYLFYSHDSYGLGHLRRTIALATAVVSIDPGASALIVTGSTVASSYHLPPGIDTVKLPAVTKDDMGNYLPTRLGTGVDDVVALRAQIARAAAQAFAPNVAIIDKAPLGVRNELLPMLEFLRETDCSVVLGLRDIDDHPAVVRKEWRAARIWQALQLYYDAVLVYGPENCQDAISCMGWSPLDIPVHRVGYVGAKIPVFGPADLPDDYLLVTVGGGGDGFEILAAVAGAIRLEPLPCPTVIVTGPLMDGAPRALVDELVRGLDVRVEDFRADMEAVVGGARAVVAMAGYNTVSELVRARKPALYVPRAKPRREQLLRAQGLFDAGRADMLHPDLLSVATMRLALRRLLARKPPAASRSLHDGASRAAEILRGYAINRVGTVHGVEVAA